MCASVKEIYDTLYERVSTTLDYEIEDRETECLMYNSIIKSLDVEDRNKVCYCLFRLIKRYQTLNKTAKAKCVGFKPKSVPGIKGSKTFIFDLDSIPESLGDMLILCLREYIFPQVQ